MTEEERFWAGEFGDEYTTRNFTAEYSQAKLSMFARILHSAPGIDSALEFGCNVGGNLDAIRSLLPGTVLSGVEINHRAAELAKVAGFDVYCGRLLDSPFTADLAFTCGVLIHTNPDQLPKVYRKLYDSSRRYVLISEYYSPRPEEIPYRGHKGRLWKRDFAGEMLDSFNLRLVDYGFVYHRGVFPQDDMTWFLMEKEGI